MTVEQAIATVRRRGHIEATGGRIRCRVPSIPSPEMEAALAKLRDERERALSLLAEESIEMILKDHAVELWAAGEHFWLVADENDARKLAEPRGTVYTAAEIRRVIRVTDPAIVGEIREWKRRFDGVISE